MTLYKATISAGHTTLSADMPLLPRSQFYLAAQVSQITLTAIKINTARDTKASPSKIF